MVTVQSTLKINSNTITGWLDIDDKKTKGLSPRSSVVSIFFVIGQQIGLVCVMKLISFIRIMTCYSTAMPIYSVYDFLNLKLSPLKI